MISASALNDAVRLKCTYPMRSSKGIPTNKDGSVSETRKKLLRILEKNNDDWVEVSGEVYDYFEKRIFIENNLEANRRLKEQFMTN